MKKQKNVLFIIADDWSPIAGCYGNNKIKTPRIDSLAEKGVVFDHAFCTSPSCAVSRASILTGQHSHTHGQYGHCHGIHGFRTSESMTSTPMDCGQPVLPQRVLVKNMLNLFRYIRSNSNQN